MGVSVHDRGVRLDDLWGSSSNDPMIRQQKSRCKGPKQQNKLREGLSQPTAKDQKNREIVWHSGTTTVQPEGLASSTSSCCWEGCDLPPTSASLCQPLTLYLLLLLLLAWLQMSWCPSREDRLIKLVSVCLSHLLCPKMHYWILHDW